MNNINIADKPSIYQKIIEICKEVQYIKKDTTIQFKQTKYNAVSYDHLNSKVRNLFISRGILIIPQVDEISRSERANGMLSTYMDVDVYFTDADNPDDTIIISVSAQADDYGDKGANKAYTYATKMAILKLLMIESGDNEEEHLDQKTNITTETVSTEEATVITHLMELTDTKTDKLLSFVSNRAGVPITGVKSIPKNLYELLYNQLKLKHKMMQEQT